MSEVPGIHAALSEAAGRIGALPKTEQNKEQHFAFRSIDSILAHAKPVFSELGISVTPSVVDKAYEQVQSSRGTRGWRCTVTMQYVFALGSDGSSITTSMVGEAVDYGDKSSTKAAQMAFKYALTQVLSIGATDADPDGESPEAVVPPDPQVPQVDLTDLIRTKVAMFSKWTEEERKDVWIAHAKKVLDGKPTSPAEVEQVVESMSEQYYEEHPPAEGEAPF